ncbi:VOC family protein [Streptomyces sp. NPDC000348]|uniref:VOC family protein n=1 Tax=Streptomyces sp. NPDC000348 TaxID=3364538 RepID=UPI0036C02B98
MIRAARTGVHVDDVAEAHAFRTGVLGFGPRTHGDTGDGTPSVTVGARASARRRLELLPEPGLPATVFSADGLRAECERPHGEGVRFVRDPRERGPVISAALDGTAGTLSRPGRPAGLTAPGGRPPAASP